MTDRGWEQHLDHEAHKVTAGAAKKIVDAYRKSARGLRYLDGHNASTRQAARRHQSGIDHADSALRDHGLRDLRGLLAEEQYLADRLAGLPRTERPELRGRVAGVRRRIRRELEALAVPRGDT